MTEDLEVEGRDAGVQAGSEVVYRAVSAQTDETDIQLPAAYSLRRIARRCRERPDLSDAQVAAAFLNEGPPLTYTERRYLEDLVFACMVGQRHLARQFRQSADVLIRMLYKYSY